MKMSNLQEQEVLLTIYTATYNCERLLPRVFESLKSQTNKNFVWYVIDDGSVDNTKSLVKKWIDEETDFSIKYFYKENGGIHTARDFAYRVCTTELIFSCDSDDWLYPDTVENILDCWTKKNAKEYLGIIGRCEFENGRLITKNFPDEASLPWQDVFFRYHCVGDTAWVFNTKYIKETADAPVFKNEKLIGELYKCMQLPNDIPILLLDKCLNIKEYQPHGYTAHKYDYLFNNPKGFREDYKQSVLHAKYFKQRMKGYLGCIAASLYLKDISYIMNLPHKFFAVTLIPLACIVLMILKKRRNNQKKGEWSKPITVSDHKPRIGIDLSYIHPNGLRGQAMCGINIIKGIERIHDGSFIPVVFCKECIEDLVRQSITCAEIVSVKNGPIYNSSSKLNLVWFYFKDLLYREFYISSIIKSGDLDSILIPHDLVSLRNVYKKIYTVFNPQDYSVFLPDKHVFRSKIFSAITSVRYVWDVRHCDKLISISEIDWKSVEPILKKYEYKMQVVYDPIDVDKSAINDGLQPSNNSIVILNYAYHHKNAVTVIKAFEKIKDRIPQNLVLIGYEYDECSRYVNEHNLQDRVIITGRIGDEDRDRWLSGSDLYVSASLYEGFGMPTIEAILMGHKVLLNDLPVNREVSCNVADFYSPATDVDALADAIIKCLDPNKPPISFENRQMIYNRYSLETIAKQYIDLLKQ